MNASEIVRAIQNRFDRDEALLEVLGLGWTPAAKAVATWIITHGDEPFEEPAELAERDGMKAAAVAILRAVEEYGDRFPLLVDGPGDLGTSLNWDELLGAATAIRDAAGAIADALEK